MLSSTKGIERFYALVGQCITEWAIVDELLFHLCLHSIGKPQQSAIVYYRTPGIDIRLNLVDELVKAILPVWSHRSGTHPHPDVSKWNQIVKDVKAILATRRRIAHQPVKPVANWIDIVVAFDELTENIVKIGPGNFEKLRVKESDVTALVISDLQSHLVEIKAIETRLYEFGQILLTHDVTPLPQAPPPSLPAHQEEDASTAPPRPPESSPK